MRTYQMNGSVTAAIFLNDLAGRILSVKVWLNTLMWMKKKLPEFQWPQMIYKIKNILIVQPTLIVKSIRLWYWVYVHPLFPFPITIR